jgi:hypothetical protein
LVPTYVKLISPIQKGTKMVDSELTLDVPRGSLITVKCVCVIVILLAGGPAVGEGIESGFSASFGAGEGKVPARNCLKHLAYI